QESPGSYAVLFSGILRLGPRTDGPEDCAEPVGLDTFQLLVDGVQACMDAGVIHGGQAFHVAAKVWTNLHGGVSLRRALPSFPWPSIGPFVDEVLHDIAGLALPSTTA